VIVLPNNKNIVPVAEQLDALTTKVVRVVPTRSMPEGLGALVVYDPEGTGDVNAAGMTAAAAQVRSGAVTRAVRPSSAGSSPIAEGDWLGIDRDEGIVAVDASIEHVVVGLLANLIDDEAGIVTVLAGEGSSDALTARIRAWVAQQRPGVEVEVHAGDQPLYPYLFGVE
jgi:dihydroxyacetone kinase-like predicted kinase